MTGRNQLWCLIIPALRSLRRDNYRDFKINPDYRHRPCHKTTTEMTERGCERFGKEAYIHFPRSEFKKEQKAVCDFNLESFS